MNVREYADLRGALDAAGVIAGISPVPIEDEVYRFVTIKFPKELGHAAVLNALWFQDDSNLELQLHSFTADTLTFDTL